MELTAGLSSFSYTTMHFTELLCTQIACQILVKTANCGLAADCAVYSEHPEHSMPRAMLENSRKGTGLRQIGEPIPLEV